MRGSFSARLAGLTVIAASLMATSALAQSVVRIGMTAADIPRTLGQPDQGFEGNRFIAAIETAMPSGLVAIAASRSRDCSTTSKTCGA